MFSNTILKCFYFITTLMGVITIFLIGFSNINESTSYETLFIFIFSFLAAIGWETLVYKALTKKCR